MMYNIFELQTTQPGSLLGTAGMSINGSGLVGGSDAQTATLWPTPATPQVVPPANPPAFLLDASLIVDVNDLGAAVGNMGTGNTDTQHPFLFIGGELLDLTMGGAWVGGGHLQVGSAVTCISNAATLVGGFAGVGTQMRGFVYSAYEAGPWSVDPLPGDNATTVTAMAFGQTHTGNLGSVIVGLSFDAQNPARNPSHGCFWTWGGGSGGLNPPVNLGPATSVEDVNLSGLVVGSIIQQLPGNTQTATCDVTSADPHFTTIPLPFGGGFIGSQGSAINNNGDVVGTCWTAETINTPDQCAFIFTRGVSIDLNALIPGNSGWHLQFANDINDSGWIVGQGWLNGQARGFLLIPVSPSHSSRTPQWASVIAEVATLLGGQAVDGSGIAIVQGIPHPIGPWVASVGDNAAKADIVIGLALEEMATHVGDRNGRTAIRRAVLEMVQSRVQTLLASLNES